MAPPKRLMSFDWYESTVGDYAEPVDVEDEVTAKAEDEVAVKVEEKVKDKAEEQTEEQTEEKVDEKVTIYIARQATNKRFRHSWSIVLFDESLGEFRTYEVRKPLRGAPCTLASSKGDPGEVGVDYIVMGQALCADREDLFRLCEQVTVTQSSNAAYANRQYIFDLSLSLLAEGFITKRQRGKAMARFVNLIRDERQQVEDETQKAEDEREKAKVRDQKPEAQGQKSKKKCQSQKKVNKGCSQGTGAFPAWFLEGGDN